MVELRTNSRELRAQARAVFGSLVGLKEKAANSNVVRALRGAFSNAQGRLPVTGFSILYGREGAVRPADLAELASRMAVLAAHDEKRPDLVRAVEDARKKLHGKVKFGQVLPHSDPALLHQLVVSERVHFLKRVIEAIEESAEKPFAELSEKEVLQFLKELPEETIEEATEELKETRLGEENADKRIFARRIEYAGGFRKQGHEDITAAICTKRHVVPAIGGRIAHDQLPGNIADVRDAEAIDFVPPQPGEDKVVVVSLYSISGMRSPEWEESAGRALAQDVYRRLHEEAVEQGYQLYITTLSPVRNFHGQPEIRKKLDACDYSPDDDMQDELCADLLNYLLTKRDPVMNFHLGNGAYIGDIKFNPGDKQDPIMINYVYPSDPAQLEKNRTFYNVDVKGEENKTRTMAPHLYNLLSPELVREARCLTEESDVVPFVPPLPRLQPKSAQDPQPQGMV